MNAPIGACPSCRLPLRRLPVPWQARGRLATCDSCGGHVASVSLLRGHVSRPVLNDFWQKARDPAAPVSPRLCPGCGNPMRVTDLGGEVRRLPVLDVCPVCQWVWLDRDERERLPDQPPPEPETGELPLKARQALGLLRSDLIRERDAGPEMGAGKAPEFAPLAVLACLGIPVEHRLLETERKPWVTWGAAVLIAIVSLVALAGGSESVTALAMVTNRGLLRTVTSAFTAVLVHNGLRHLVLNLYFLVVFGDDVESEMGPQRYVLLLVAAGLVGNAMHGYLDPRPEVPLMGASGVVSGILAYYALAFPSRKLTIVWLFRYLNFPALILIAFWFGRDLLGAVSQLSGGGSVSHLAHLGGAAAGIIARLLTCRRK